MSLEVDGVWKAGVWATTVWADGVWREGEPPAQPDPVVQEEQASNWQSYRPRTRTRKQIEEDIRKERVALGILPDDTVSREAFERAETEALRAVQEARDREIKLRLEQSRLLSEKRAVEAYKAQEEAEIQGLILAEMLKAYEQASIEYEIYKRRTAILLLLA